MGHSLSQEQIHTLESALHGQHGEALLFMMKSMSLGRRDVQFAPEAVLCALDAELVSLDETGRPVLTPVGWLVSDSIREYVFWLERDRLLREYDKKPAFADSVFRGKRILELGSGVGCNLFSLQPIAASVFGIEIEHAYVQMASILATLAGIEPPEVKVGPAEEIPLPDRSQDLVFAFGAFQFMEFPTVLSEVARVLDTGGTFMAILSPLDLFVGYEIREALEARNPKRFLRSFLVAGNTIHEQWRGKRTGWFENRNPLNRAVYPTRRRMRQLLREAGLVPDEDLTEDHQHERTHVARKPN